MIMPKYVTLFLFRFILRTKYIHTRDLLCCYKYSQLQILTAQLRSLQNPWLTPRQVLLEQETSWRFKTLTIYNRISYMIWFFKRAWNTWFVEVEFVKERDYTNFASNSPPFWWKGQLGSYPGHSIRTVQVRPGDWANELTAPPKFQSRAETILPAASYAG